MVLSYSGLAQTHASSVCRALRAGSVAGQRQPRLRKRDDQVRRDSGCGDPGPVPGQDWANFVVFIEGVLCV